MGELNDDFVTIIGEHSKASYIRLDILFEGSTWGNKPEGPCVVVTRS